MPLSKPEVALEFFDIDPEKYENDEAFKEAAAKDWTKVSEAVTHPEVIKATTGRVNGLIMGELKKAFKELELPTEGLKWDDMKTTEVVAALTGTAKKTFGEREAKLAESLKGKGSEEAKKEYDRQLAEQAKKIEEYEKANGTLRGEIDGMKKADQEREVSGKINGAWEQASLTALKEVKFKNDLEKKGFEAAARERFQVRFDEKGESYWAGKDGNRIQDGAKHQAFKDGAQLLKELATELKVGDANPRGGERVGQKPAPQRTIDDGIVKPVRQRILATPGRVLTDAPPPG